MCSAPAPRSQTPLCGRLSDTVHPYRHFSTVARGTHGARLLSEATAVDLGDGVGSHGTADAGAGWRTLGYRGDAVGRVLTGWREGRITRHAQTVFCH